MIRLSLRSLLRSLSIPAALGLSACGIVEKPNPFVGWYKDFATCREEYEAFDARVDAAGVRDAAYYPVPGYPYLRTDRTIASFAHEIESPEQIGGWIRRMREFDREAREFEFMNLGMSLQERGIQRHRFLQCSHALTGIELSDDAAVARLKDVAQPPDEYSGAARTFGLYPLMVPALHARIDEARLAAEREFSLPLEALDSRGELHLWQVKPLKDPALAERGFQEAFADELGFPGLVESQWAALAEKHAPRLWIETASDQDRPGVPVWTDAGIDVDPSQALLYYTVSFARFGDRPVAQITYVAWFRGPSRTAPIDGLLWRVNLDVHAQPLVYESLHASGHSHYWFPVQPLQRRETDDRWAQPEIFPQARVPQGRPTLRLKAGSHTLRRVANETETRPSHTLATYELRPYEDLYLLPLPGGGTRSLFGPDGVVPGSGGQDPMWMWASGVKNPGAIKQYGHQTPSYIGRAHFDAPFLLESVFVPPRPRF